MQTRKNIATGEGSAIAGCEACYRPTSRVPDGRTPGPAQSTSCETEAALATCSHALIDPSCVVCGTQNPKGLRIEFTADYKGATAAWTPSREWESFQHTVHGGILATVLDEAMSRAIIALGWGAMTAEMTVRFRGRVSPGDGLRVRGWIVNRQKRRIMTEATIMRIAGEERAHAWAKFLLLPAPKLTTG